MAQAPKKFLYLIGDFSLAHSVAVQGKTGIVSVLPKDLQTLRYNVRTTDQDGLPLEVIFYNYRGNLKSEEFRRFRRALFDRKIPYEIYKGDQLTKAEVSVHYGVASAECLPDFVATLPMGRQGHTTQIMVFQDEVQLKETASAAKERHHGVHGLDVIEDGFELNFAGPQ
jgi:hypothetical protein